jgi:hypothetical protein
MAEVINLRTVRKRAKREEDAKRAAENRVTHGRPSASWSKRVPRSAAATLTPTGSSQETADEIARHQALHCGRGP